MVNGVSLGQERKHFFLKKEAKTFIISDTHYDKNPPT
jgi:hypothetical protein